MHSLARLSLLMLIAIAAGCARGGYVEDPSSPNPLAGAGEDAGNEEEQVACQGDVCLLDNFESGLSGHWLGATDAFSANGGALTVAAPGAMLWNEPFGPNQEVSVRLSNLTPGWFYRLILKAQDPNPSAGEALYVEIDAVSGVHVHTGWSVGTDDYWVEDKWHTLATGDVFRVIAWENGDIDIYKGDELLTTALVDTFPFHDQGGYVGIKTLAGAAPGALDEFRAGNVPPR